ncbi:MAG: hypothetical protein AAGA18_03280 [Verrucomicrobiota bacterium]
MLNIKPTGIAPLTIFAVLFSIVGCSKQKEGNFKERLLALEKSPERELRVVFEYEGIPKIWCDAWLANGGLKITQFQFHENLPDDILLDAELYILTPRKMLGLAEEVALVKLDDKLKQDGVSPVFTNHPFDIDGLYTRPWRWTPYLFLVRNPENKGDIYRNWRKAANSAWPKDKHLLAALSLKESGKVANPANLDERNVIGDVLAEELMDKLFDEKTLWRKYKDLEIDVTYIPLSYLVKNSHQIPAGTYIKSPAQGSMILFDHLLLGAKAVELKEAMKLAEWLLDDEKQNEMLNTCGYFKVISKLGKEMDGVPLVLPTAWFNRADFLLEVSQDGGVIERQKIIWDKLAQKEAEREKASKDLIGQIMAEEEITLDKADHLNE